MRGEDHDDIVRQLEQFAKACTRPDRLADLSIPKAKGSLGR
jgi:hypothetical protein